MYESDFGFRSWPFSLLPDVKFHYLSAAHQQALIKLEYALESQAIGTLITGDVGCGKTTLLQKFSDDAPDQFQFGLISSYHDAFGDILQWVLTALNKEPHGLSKTQKFDAFCELLKAEHSRNRRVVLLVDEAQNLGSAALEELRMLSNIGVQGHQCLQLILVGQPELRSLINRPELLQLSQRISVDHHIGPLNGDETGEYIRYRLAAVGGEESLFDPETFSVIHSCSHGVPRLINTIFW